MQILLQMNVTSEPGLFVLGSYEDRVTIYSQQIRACNFVYALNEIEGLGKGKKLAVIGAGIGGMAAAAAAASLGVETHIYERHSEVLHNLRGCHTRHLHPRVYDWPEEDALEPATDLPFLNWTADTADRVAIVLLEQWEHLVVSHSIKVHTSASVIFHERIDGKRRITKRSSIRDYEDFDFILLATGFGSERTIPPQPLRSYWRDDSLHQPEIEPRTTRTRYLVSGNGDGGLIDILRLRLRDFRHETLLAEIVGEGLGEVERHLKAAEREIQNLGMRTQDAGERILKSYETLSVPAGVEAKLRARLRQDTHVTFNYAKHPFSHRSSILHRFLVWMLSRFDENLHGLPGKLTALDGHEPTISATIEAYNGTIREIFDRVVVRHGPQLAIARDFPACHALFEPILRARNVADLTRKREWLDTSFPGSVSWLHPATGTPTPPTSSFLKVELDDMRHPEALKILLLKGMTNDLDRKLALISKEAKADLLEHLTLESIGNEDVIKSIGALLNATPFDDELLRMCLSIIVEDAVFSDSLSRKAKVLELGTEFLKKAHPDLLMTLLSEVFKIIQNDQFTEVNLIVPSLIQAQAAIPEALYIEYVETMLTQYQSGSWIGAPAAKGAIIALPQAIFETFVDHLNPAYLLRFYYHPGVRALINSRPVSASKQELIRDFLSMDAIAFSEKYSSAAT